MGKNLRIGVVPYMNAKPLIYGLQRYADSIDLIFRVPALLSKMLNDGLVDVALIPSIEYFRNGNYAIIPDISISSHGAVESVKIFSKVPIKDIRTLATDKSSLTSCALTKILMKGKYHLSPEYSVWNGQYNISQIHADAALIIGDNAIMLNDVGYLTLDLGYDWYIHTGLPFVYAFWVVKKDQHITGVNQLLKDAKEAGIQSVETVARAESERLNLPLKRCLNYLTRSIRYQLGSDEIKGLLTFYKYAISMELAPEGIEIVFNEN